MTPHPQQEQTYCKDCIDFYEEKRSPTYWCRWTLTTRDPMSGCNCTPSHYCKNSAPSAPMTEEQRKYILSFHEEDPLLIAYVEGQEHPSQKAAATIRNQTLDDFDKEIMKKEEWTRMELLAIIAQKKSHRTPSTQQHERGDPLPFGHDDEMEFD